MNSSRMATSPNKFLVIFGFLMAFNCLSAFGQDKKSEANDPISIVQNYIDAFNKGNVQGMVGAFASPGFILDGMSPHVWQGPNAPRDWYQDAQNEAKQHGVSEHFIVISKPLHHDVTGNYAYIAVPASFTYKMNGKLIKQTGAFFTVALRKVNDRWLIASWAWTKGASK